ncbi:response regulator transcription factor [Sporomusa sphaeroides]|uniref:response regulator transcription factor n=1 Tax=Sporomusa sphaeroides TaxID=47679 RepID=UPI002C525579|nr:response regulator transcription factor [Sporomusa sphaeroides]HML31999.1 response regulator transcription factor [Sporomusa sphaeroides]
MTHTNVIIVDDHALMRSGLKLILANQDDIHVVGEADNGVEALQLIESTQPDIVLLDISMPGMNGLECLQTIRGKFPTIKVILLTMHEDMQYLRQGLANGAMGYVLKKSADDVLYQAIRTVCSGSMFLPASTGKIITSGSDARQGQKNVGFDKPLSEKEKKVLGLIAMGYTNAEIAEQLIISVKTVETYKYRIMEKLQTRKRSELVKYAVQNGLTESGD